MASDKNKCANRKKIKDWRISSVRNETVTHSDESFNDNNDGDGTGRRNPKSGVPKFLRTQSSSGILPSPRKSRSATRFFSNLLSASSSDSFSEKPSNPDKNWNYSSLTNLARLISPSNRGSGAGTGAITATISLNQSKSLRSVADVIDENTEFRLLASDPMEMSLTNSLESSPNSSRSMSRLSRYRTQRFRRRSISWDSSQTAKALLR